MHKVHGTIHRIDNPGGFIAQQLLLALARFFLANESASDETILIIVTDTNLGYPASRYSLVVRELGQQTIDEFTFHLLVRLSQQVNVAGLFHHLLLSRISASDYLKISQRNYGTRESVCIRQ